MFGPLGTSFELLRPRTLARTGKRVDELVTDARDLRRAMKALTTSQRQIRDGMADLLALVEALSGELGGLRQEVGDLAREHAQMRAIFRADARLEAALAALPSILDEPRVAAHAASAISKAQLRCHPCPHIVVEELFPDDLYAALIKGLPPVELFGDKRSNKHHVNLPLTVAPVYCRRVWNFLVHVVLPRAVHPALIEKFRQPLEAWVSAHWPDLSGAPLAAPMELHTADGRIMLRERGYEIAPHRDPKWGFLTGIVYLARHGDCETWGTQLYSVENDVAAAGAAPHWIDPERCRLAAEVPYRPNTMLAFLNSTGAHGARIPWDAEPEDLRRYIYQFRIGPSASAIPRLYEMLSEEHRPLWAGKLAAS